VSGGPLAGVKVVELAAIGPVPFAGMVLSDLGADVVRVDRPTEVTDDDRARAHLDVVRRGRRSIALDLRSDHGRDRALALVERADALLEGFRPGVVERLGLGPEACLEVNPRLVYGRMTGWGQDGPLAGAAGHDIDFIALSGALEAIGRRGSPPVPPLNLVGDNGGGGMLLAIGVLAGLHEARSSGRGQVVDASIVDGSALLTANFHGFVAEGRWDPERGANQCTGAPFYEVYETADGRWVAVGAQEERFYRELVQRLGLDPDELPDQWDRSAWPEVKARFAAVFAGRTQAEWCAALEGTDACFAPVLSFAEAPTHPHNRARGTFVSSAGVVQPAPAPRFDRTPGAIARPAPWAGQHTDAVLEDWGIGPEPADGPSAGGSP
jgi:alpha-methylacyl-CoA racemase